MNKANKIIFRRSDFKSDDEFFDSLFKQIRLLVENNNVISFHENPNFRGIYALQFNPINMVGGDEASYPVWLTGDEILYVSAYARRNEYEEAKQVVDDFEGDDIWDMNDDNSGNGGKSDA